MPICFVIMPFGKSSDNHDEDYWTKHFEQFIKPAIEEARDGNQILDYKAILANPPGGGIIEDVFKNLQEADVVLADLTDFNANVIYELALRQCLKDRTIMILEKGPEPPFYFKNYKIIRYATNTIPDGNKFREDIRRSLIELTQNPHSSSDNPISDYLFKTGQTVRLTASQSPEINISRKSGFKRIYTQDDNHQRNISKQQAIQEATGFVRLLASSGHAYLAWIQSPFRDTVEERLKVGTPIQVILINPWSESKVLLSLGEFANGAPKLGSVQAIALEKMKQGDLRGFDPVALIEQSINYRDKYSTSIRGYQDFQTRFGNLIELRICTIVVTATVLLTENTGFCEPYMHVNPDERMRKAMNTFEIEFSSSSYLYHHCKDYFDMLWNFSLPYDKFVVTEDDWKKELRGKYGWKTDPPDSTA